MQVFWGMDLAEGPVYFWQDECDSISSLERVPPSLASTLVLKEA